MLKIYAYGYLNPVQSSRRLEAEARRNLELIWLKGRLAPDFKTIADFRRDNGEAIRKGCKEFVLLCRRMKLFTDGSVAIDGSKFKAWVQSSRALRLLLTAAPRLDDDVAPAILSVTWTAETLSWNDSGTTTQLLCELQASTGGAPSTSSRRVMLASHFLPPEPYRLAHEMQRASRARVMATYSSLRSSSTLSCDLSRPGST